MAGEQPFYLSCRIAQQVLDLPCPATANNWMNGLVTCKILRVTAKGGPHNNKANRYRYLPPLD